VNEINVAGESLDIASFEIERIVGDQDGGIGTAFNLYGAVDVVEKAVAGADVVMGFAGFDVLVVVIQLNVAGGNGFVGPDVVFDVVGAEARAAIVDVHIAVGGDDVALAALRFCFHVGDAAFAGGEAGLLSENAPRKEAGWNGENRRQKENLTGRGESPCMRMMIHSEHAIKESSGIA
jgi:hypothetical protein